METHLRQEFAIVADMTTRHIAQLPTPAQDYIRALEAQVSALNERIQLLEEQFRLAQSKRFAPTSEKMKDRVFDEAEQLAVSAGADEKSEAASPFYAILNVTRA